MTKFPPAVHVRKDNSFPGPRVLALIHSVGGCELYRIAMPYNRLTQLGYKVGWCSTEQFPRVNLDEWDVIVLPRIGLEGDWRQFINDLRGFGKTIVYEMDDDLLHIPEHNPNHNPEMAAQMLPLMQNADLITVSTNHLAKVMREVNPNVTVLPNYIDPDIWKFQGPVRTIPGLTVGLHGSPTHHRDWQVLTEVFPAVAEQCPNVTFVVAGYCPDYLEGLLGDRLVKMPWVPVEQYPLLVAQIDIGLCPLDDDPFTRSKSFIKAMEFSMVGAAVVASPNVYGELIQNSRSGFLARTAPDWIRSIVKLVTKPKLRREIAKALRGEVLLRHNIQREAWRWMSAYTEAWQKTTRA